MLLNPLRGVGGYTIGGKKHVVSNKSRFHETFSLIESNAQERRRRRAWRIPETCEEHDRVTKPDQMAWGGRSSSKGKLQSVRSLHR